MIKAKGSSSSLSKETKKGDPSDRFSIYISGISNVRCRKGRSSPVVLYVYYLRLKDFSTLHWTHEENIQRISNSFFCLNFELKLEKEKGWLHKRKNVCVCVHSSFKISCPLLLLLLLAWLTWFSFYFKVRYIRKTVRFNAKTENS